MSLILLGLRPRQSGTRGLACPKLIITAEELPSDAFEEELERER